jgi:hypothetical protein
LIINHIKSLTFFQSKLLQIAIYLPDLWQVYLPNSWRLNSSRIDRPDWCSGIEIFFVDGEVADFSQPVVFEHALWKDRR